MILTIYIMAPVAIEVKNQSADLIEARTGSNLLSSANADVLLEAGKRAAEPIRQFLIKHAHKQERVLFLDLARQLRKPEERASLTDKDLIILVPAFVISELQEAFEIGFILFVPFIIIDMVVSNILLAMGMFMLSPVTVFTSVQTAALYPCGRMVLDRARTCAGLCVARGKKDWEGGPPCPPATCLLEPQGGQGRPPSHPGFFRRSDGTVFF